MRAALLTIATLALGGACGPKAKPKVTPVVRAEALSHDAYAHYLRGQLAAFEGDMELAIRELRQATHAAPKEASPLIALAQALYKNGQRHQALAALERGQKEWPDDMRIWRESGHLQRSFRRHAIAIKHYRRALELAPGDAETAVALGEQYLWLDENKKALKVFAQLQREQGELPDGYFGRARALMQQERWKEATGALDSVIELTPWVTEAWAYRAHCKARLGDEKGAGEDLRIPFDRSRGDTDLAADLVDALLEQGNEKLALGTVALLDRDDLSPDARISLGGTYLRLAAFGRALDFAKTLEERLGRSPALDEYKARALIALGRVKEAATLLGAVPTEHPAFAPLRALAIEALIDAGLVDEAAALMAPLAELARTQPDLLLASASLARAQGSSDHAWTILDEAQAEHPGSPRLYIARAELARQLGDTNKAIAIAEEFVSSRPRDATALNYLGFVLLEARGATKRTRDLLERALDASPHSPFIQDSFGWLLFKEGKLDEARPYLEGAARRTPDEPELLWHLAELEKAQGQASAAAGLYGRALRLCRNADLCERIKAAAQQLPQGS